MRSLVFLDFDDVVCLSEPYGGYDVLAPNPPPDLWDRLFHRPAVEVLRDTHDGFTPLYVITSSWVRFLDREAAVQVLGRGGLGFVADNLHTAWDAEQLHGQDRAHAIRRWMSRHHCGEPFVVLDDENSGTGLRATSWHRAGRVILCAEGVGLTADHLPAIRAILAKRPNVKLRP